MAAPWSTGRAGGVFIAGPPIIVSPGFSVYEESDQDHGHKYGDICKVGNRLFAFAKNGAVALAAGKMCQGPAGVANHLNCAVNTAAVVGATEVKVTLGATAATANQYTNGYLHVNDVDGEGQTLRIKSHPAADASASLTVTTYDPLVVALTTSSEATLSYDPCQGVVIAPNGGLTNVCVGVPLKAVTASYYCWLAIYGPTAVLTQGTAVVGQPVGLGGTADGACGPVAADTTDIWGRVIRVNASTEYSLIHLTLL